MKPVMRRFGRGPELVLLPGWSMPAETLRPWAERLALSWRVRLLELPGHGASAEPWPALDALPEQLAEALPADALWVGWSLGGLLLLAAAGCRPPAALCLLSASPRFCSGDDWPYGIPAAELQAMREALPRRPERVLGQFLALLARAGRGSRAAALQLKRVQAGYPPNVAALAAGLEALAELDLRGALPALGMPVSWVGGDDDPLVPPAAVRWSAARTPQGRACVIEGAGHLPFLTHADAVEAELTALRAKLGAQ